MARNTEHEAAKVERARRWIKANPAQVLVMCVGCIVVLMMVLGSQRPSSPRPATHEWLYDTVTGELVAGPLGSLPPIKAGEGELWLARVYSCGGCEDSFIAYFEKMTPQARQRSEQLRAAAERGPLSFEQEQEMYELSMSGWLYSRDGEKWAHKDLMADERLTLELESRCPQGVRYCLPGPHDLP